MDYLLNLLSDEAPWFQALVGFAALSLAAILVNYVLKFVILRAAAPLLDRKSNTIDKAATWLATVAPLLVMSSGIVLVPYLPGWVYTFVTHVGQALIVFSVAMAIVKTLTYLNEVYERRPEARNRPIKGFVQVIKIVVLCGAAIIMISILIDESPLLLLSGLGAITAVLVLVFKDTILSFVASVQLTTNDMLRVGDWITMPSMNADGDVIDISLHTVKVQNFDKTIITIPTHRLVSDSFANWRGMAESGGRRIKRSLSIDQGTIRFLTDEEVDALKRFLILRPYLEAKRDELSHWNTRNGSSAEAPVNMRRLTNIGTFRAYIEAYLRSHPRLNEASFTLMVRQLPPSSLGLPIELYCFTDTTVWVEYESIQADLFDHLLAIVSEFDLALFQEPSGVDVRQVPPGVGAV